MISVKKKIMKKTPANLSLLVEKCMVRGFQGLSQNAEFKQWGVYRHLSQPSNPDLGAWVCAFLIQQRNLLIHSADHACPEAPHGRTDGDDPTVKSTGCSWSSELQFSSQPLGQVAHICLEAQPQETWHPLLASTSALVRHYSPSSCWHTSLKNKINLKK